jgi:uncharacterized protein YraI
MSMRRMPRRPLILALLLCALLPALLALRLPAAPAQPEPQQAASATPPPVRIEAYQDVFVRSGPGTEYDRLGVLIAGQTGEIIGRSSNHQWIKIVYVGPHGTEGWVFRDLVRIIADMTTVPVAEAPPTPTLPPTATSAFGLPAALSTATPGPDRPPTFTPPVAEIRPTLLPVQGVRESVTFPPAVLIISLSVLGVFGGLLSVLRSRR